MSDATASLITGLFLLVVFGGIGLVVVLVGRSARQRRPAPPTGWAPLPADRLAALEAGFHDLAALVGSVSESLADTNDDLDARTTGLRAEVERVERALWELSRSLHVDDGELARMLDRPE